MQFHDDRGVIVLIVMGLILFQCGICVTYTQRSCRKKSYGHIRMTDMSGLLIVNNVYNVVASCMEKRDVPDQNTRYLGKQIPVPPCMLCELPDMIKYRHSCTWQNT